MNSQWSFSSLKQMINCPRQYHEIKILKNYISVDTQATLYGKEVHSALESYVRDGVPLAKNYSQFQAAVDALLQIPGDRYCELKMGLKADRVTPCEFDDPEYWVHGIADLIIVDGDIAYVTDYKTGSARYADTKQLRLMSLMIYARFPEVQAVKGGLLFLGQNIFIPDDNRREQINDLWKSFDPALRQLNLYLQRGEWPANPTGLCKKHCPVTTCQYNGSYR